MLILLEYFMQQSARYLMQKDNVMSKIIPQLPELSPLPKMDPYIALLKSIIGQQLSLSSAEAIWQRFNHFFSTGISADNILLKEEHELRELGLSLQKIKYIQALSSFYLSETNFFKNIESYSDEEIINTLVSVYGIGRWTVQMLLIFSLNREDVFAIDDLIIKKMIMELYNVNEKGKALVIKLNTISEQWIPYRSIACRYLWHWRGNLKRTTKKH